MAKVTIGKRTTVENIRTVWAKEADFSDWLATTEGMELLSQDLDLQIENPKREQRGANFPCDIVANLVGGEERMVVIENQFGRTNHDHLAKLITYAATHNAMIGIWIAEEVADDHRQVIDWLNKNTPDTIGLYLAELKAYTIGGSPPAPQLDLVCRPNVTMKQGNADVTDAERERRERRISFWQDIQQRMKKEKLPFQLQKPGPDHWSSIAIGRAGFHLSMLLTPKNQSVVVELNIHCAWKSSAFAQLKSVEGEIQKEIGRALDWRSMPDKVSARILLEERIDPGVEENRKKICDWFAEWTPKMFIAFKDRVKALSEPEQE